MFLLLKLDGRWNLINPMATCEKLVSIPFLSPTEIDSEMKAGPLGIPKEMPMYDSAFNSGLTIFDAWTLDAYPRHGFSDRYNLAASGTLKSPNCRYEARDFRGRGGQNTAPPAAAGR